MSNKNEDILDIKDCDILSFDQQIQTVVDAYKNTLCQQMNRYINLARERGDPIGDIELKIHSELGEIGSIDGYCKMRDYLNRKFSPNPDDIQYDIDIHNNKE